VAEASRPAHRGIRRIGQRGPQLAGTTRDRRTLQDLQGRRTEKLLVKYGQAVGVMRVTHEWAPAGDHRQLNLVPQWATWGNSAKPGVLGLPCTGQMTAEVVDLNGTQE